MSTIIIVKVVKLSVIKLNHIPQSVEALNVCLVHMLEYRINHNHILEVRTVFDEVDLVECELVVDNEHGIDISCCLVIRVVLLFHLNISFSRVVCDLECYSATYKVKRLMF